MKQLLAALLFVAACGPKAATTSTPTGNEGTVAPTEPSIRSVDFANFTYDAGEEGTFTVVDGSYEFAYDADGNQVPPDYVPANPDDYVEHGEFNVGSPVYGDVTGDGVEDALISTMFNGGGTGRFDDIRVYTMVGGAPKVVGGIPGGDRGDGGISDFSVDGGTVHVDRFLSADGDGACCPSKIVHEEWRWDGQQLVEDVAARVIEDYDGAA